MLDQTCGSKEEEADTYPTSPKSAHDPDTDKSTAEVDGSQNYLGNERVLDSDRLEDSRAVAEAQNPHQSVPPARGPN